MIRPLLMLVAFALCGVFASLFHARYFKWRACFNEQGRCFDPETGLVYLEQSGPVWLSLAIVSLALALFQAWRLLTKAGR